MYRCANWTIRKGEWQQTELLNCGASEDSWESLIQQGDQTSHSERNQPLTPAVSAEPSTEGLQVERTDASTAKVPNRGRPKQIVSSSTFGGSSGWRLCERWLSWYMHCISPAALEAKEGAFWALEEGDGSGIHWGHHLPSRTGKDRAGICGRELVSGVWEQEGTSSAWATSPKLPWRRSPVIRSSEMGRGESISLPLRIPLNEEVVELVGHHKLFHGLDHPSVAILGAAFPQLQACSSGRNWASCVLLGQGQWPWKASHRTSCPWQDCWSGDVQVNWGGSFREHHWTLISLSFFPY